MLAVLPKPDTWEDIGGAIEASALKRSLAGRLGLLFATTQSWVDQWHEALLRWDYEQELADKEAERQANEQALYEGRMEEGAYIAEEAIPRILNQVGLSYRRTVQDRRAKRYKEVVDYVEIDEWFFDEAMYYFHVDTVNLPYKVKVTSFLEEERSAKENLSASLKANVTIENNDWSHPTLPGLWICMEHRAGTGKIPKRVDYEKLYHLVEDYAQKKRVKLPILVGQEANKQVRITSLDGQKGIVSALVGGSTGGGKSNMINSMLATFLRLNSPDELRLFLVDFKRVELAFYRGIPHLGGDVPYGTSAKKVKKKDSEDNEEEETFVYTSSDPAKADILNPPYGRKIITEIPDLVMLLKYVLAEIERRLKEIEGNYRNIDRRNLHNPKNQWSRWVIVIDELADAMLQARSKIETPLDRITALGRAVGVHVIAATQTPKNSVVPQLLQNNLRVRIAFRCATGQASGTMLDGRYEAARIEAGIPGRAIYRESGPLSNLQTPYISDPSISRIIKEAKDGTSAGGPRWKIDPQHIFDYALKHLGGECDFQSLYSAFQKEIDKKQLISILQYYEVMLDKNTGVLEPEIEMSDGNVYYLAERHGRWPRRLLIEEDYLQFLAETKEDEEDASDEGRDEEQENTWRIDPMDLFRYAVENLDGKCSTRQLYDAFREKGIPRQEILEILSEYDIKQCEHEKEIHFFPEIHIEGCTFILSPAYAGIPRTLITKDNFLNEYKEKWADLVFRVPCSEFQVPNSSGFPESVVGDSSEHGTRNTTNNGFSSNSENENQEIFDLSNLQIEEISEIEEMTE